MQVDQLIAELLTTGTMNEETVADLNRMLDDWRAGNLDPDDAGYLEALHGRIVHGAIAEPPSTHLSSPKEHLDGLSIEQWRDRALKAEATLAAEAKPGA